MRRVRLRALHVGVVVASSTLAAFAYVVLAKPYDEQTTGLLTNLLSLLAPIVGALGAGFAAARSRARTRTAWTFLALACASWGVGQAAWMFYEEVLGVEVPFPSLADVGYLGFIPLAIAGLALAPSESTTTGARVRTLVDGLIIAASIFILSWRLLLDDMFAASSGDLSFVVGIAYPIGDVLLATCVVLLASRGTGGRARWWLVGGGILAFAIADSAFLYLTANGLYMTGMWVDLGWAAGLVLVGIAGCAAGDAPRDAPVIDRATNTAASLFVPYMPFAVAIVFLAAQTQVEGVGPSLFWTLAVLSLLVVLRQLLALQDNMRLTESLRATNARLSVSETSRIRLLNTITHDLLNPMTPMRLQLDILERAKPEPTPQQMRALGVIRRNLELLQRLVKDLKDVARLEAGKLPLSTERVDVGPLIDHAIETYAPLAAERGLTLRAERTSALRVVADRERLTQILFNLVSNALKFTPPGGEITVGISADERGGRVWVRDTGRGLTEDEIARLFKPFSQVHEASETPERGTGLGLFLSRAIAEQHGGSLRVESAGRSRGSTFVLSLPQAT